MSAIEKTPTTKELMLQRAGREHGGLTATHIERINSAHHNVGAQLASAQAAAGRAIASAIECGALLRDAKKIVVHGTWADWLERNFDGSHRTANDYMRLAEHADNEKVTRAASVREALAALKKPRLEESKVITSAAAMIEAGEDGGVSLLSSLRYSAYYVTELAQRASMDSDGWRAWKDKQNAANPKTEVIGKQCGACTSSVPVKVSTSTGDYWGEPEFGTAWVAGRGVVPFCSSECAATHKRQIEEERRERHAESLVLQQERAQRDKADKLIELALSTPEAGEATSAFNKARELVGKSTIPTERFVEEAVGSIFHQATDDEWPDTIDAYAILKGES